MTSKYPSRRERSLPVPRHHLEDDRDCAERSSLERFEHTETDFRRKRYLSAVMRTLESAFAGELRDPAFAEIELVEVGLSDDGVFLTLSLLATSPTDRAFLQARLERAAPLLRSAIARDIVRKRTPELRFLLLDGGDE